MTYRLAVLGNPIEHSLSPQIHIAALEALGLEAEFNRVVADEMILASHLEMIRDDSLTGINVTMPLKQSAASLVDRRSPDADGARSVNTVFKSGDELHGESTDASAMRRLLVEHWPADQPLYILGSGGAAAAAAMAAGERVVYVTSRNSSAASDLADRLADGSSVPWGVPVKGAVVINATPLGMHGEDLPGGIIESAGGFIDLPYGQRDTPGMVRAASTGVFTVGGIEFLVAQAADSFRAWTGEEPPVEVMLAAARRAVAERNT